MIGEEGSSDWFFVFARFAFDTTFFLLSLEYCVLFSLNFYGNSLDVFTSQKRLIRVALCYFLCV
jgi:hypothetical protein